MPPILECLSMGMFYQVYLLQKEKGLLETSRAGWEAQERVLRVKIQHREEQLDGGEVMIKYLYSVVTFAILIKAI